MENIKALLKEAFQLRKNKEWKQALALYQPIWNSHTEAFGEWDGWGYGQCLRETKQYQQALEVCRILYTRFSAFEQIRQLYAWCIYYTELSGDKQPADYALYKKAVNGIITLCPPQNAFSPAIRSVFKIVKWLSVKPNPDWPEILTWLNKIDKKDLQQETYRVDVPGRKTVELASDLEEWYSYQSKALLQTGQWAACVALCDEASATINQYHYSNDIWFGRRKAAALSKLGKKTEAAELVKSLLNKKREWFMLQDLAELTENKTEALALCTEAALQKGDYEKKLRLYNLLGNLCRQQALAPWDDLHYLLIISLRKENEWPVSAELEAMVISDEQKKKMGSRSADIIKQLVPFWQKQAESKNPRLQGKIDRLMGEGRSGFIGYGKKTIYFSISDWEGRAPKLAIGQIVSFREAPAFDVKKNKETIKAINLRLER